MKHGETATVEEALEGIRRSGSRDSLGTIFTAVVSFSSIFEGAFQYMHNPYTPSEYKAALVFKDKKWLDIIEQAQESVTRFYHMGQPKDDLEKAEQYKKIWDNSTLGEKLLGHLNVLMEHLKGRIMVVQHTDLKKDCILAFRDKEIVEYMKEVVGTYVDEYNSGKRSDIWEGI
jgi:hypothetical protein